jgi:hypothetical protein
MVKRSNMCRISPELIKKINRIRARAILEGRKPPSFAKITEKMAKQIKEELLWNEFIKL